MSMGYSRTSSGSCTGSLRKCVGLAETIKDSTNPFQRAGLYFIVNIDEATAEDLNLSGEQIEEMTLDMCPNS